MKKSEVKRAMRGSLILVTVCLCACLCAVGCSSYFEEESMMVRIADIIMTVSHETVYLRCGPDGDGPAECILVMDEDYPGEWRPMLCGDIEGFDYLVGYEYTLRVRRTFIKSARNEGPAIEYQLVEVLHKEKVEE